MSRIGKMPVIIDSGIQVTVSPDNVVNVKAAKVNHDIKVSPLIDVKVEDGKVILTRKEESKKARAMHGLFRALIYNTVYGATKGFSKNLELNGVGYRAGVKGKNLEMNLGYSHPIVFPIPDGIEIKVEKQTKLSVSGPNKELVGQVSAKIRSFRPPEPFLGKGVKYADEHIRRKAGKAAGK